MAEAPDEQLMLAYRGGDAGAFDTLYARHRIRLFRFVLRSIKVRGVAKHLLHFGAAESCGKCFPCRIGLRRAHEMFVHGAPVSRERLEELLETLEAGSLCAHGGGMPAPIRSLIEHFPGELGLR